MKSNRPDSFAQTSPRETINIVYILLKGLAACVWPFIRSDLGIHALGAPGLVAFLIIIVYAAAQNAPQMMTYLAAWLVVAAWKNAKARRQSRRGRGQHSRYDGFPFVAMKLPFVRTESQAKGIEPFLCFFAGAMTCALDPAIGGFVALGAFGMLAVRIMDLKAHEERIRQMRDAMIEMEQLGEDLRRLR